MGLIGNRLATGNLPFWGSSRDRTIILPAQLGHCCQCVANASELRATQVKVQGIGAVSKFFRSRTVCPATFATKRRYEPGFCERVPQPEPSDYFSTGFQQRLGARIPACLARCGSACGVKKSIAVRNGFTTLMPRTANTTGSRTSRLNNWQMSAWRNGEKQAAESPCTWAERAPIVLIGPED